MATAEARGAGIGTPVSLSGLEPSVPLALRFLNHRGQSLDEGLRTRIERAARRCAQTSSCRFVWRPFPRASAQARRALNGYDIDAHIGPARAIVLLACTLGSGCERELRRLSLLQPADALIFDACASALIEACANAASEDVAAWAAREGRTATRRFSPGYGDYPLSAHVPILDALDAQRLIGLTLTTSGLMIPTKSITAVIGIREADGIGETLKG